MIENILVYAGLLLVVISIKNAVTYINRRKIDRAIFYHHLHILLFVKPGNTEWDVDYSDVEPYTKTLWRLWDWGYTRILPKEKFEIVKPFMSMEE